MTNLTMQNPSSLDSYSDVTSNVDSISNINQFEIIQYFRYIFSII